MPDRKGLLPPDGLPCRSRLPAETDNLRSFLASCGPGPVNVVVGERPARALCIFDLCAMLGVEGNLCCGPPFSVGARFTSIVRGFEPAADRTALQTAHPVFQHLN